MGEQQAEGNQGEVEEIRKTRKAKGCHRNQQAVTERLLTDSLPLEHHPGWAHGQNLSP